MTSISDDPVIDEIREIRHRISAQFGHDPKKLVDHFITLQEQHRDRLMRNDSTSAPTSAAPLVDVDLPMTRPTTES